MTLSPQWLDELRARTTLSAIIAPTVKLTKAGREFKACCPFHNEKTPSFYVNDEKGFYHCLAGETLVITGEGRRPIHELAGSRAAILSRDGQWLEADFDHYGRQQLWEIQLSRNGVRKTIHATSGHRWFVNEVIGSRTTDQLRPGHCLQSALPTRRDNWRIDPGGIRHGILFGDGTTYKGDYGTINLHGEKDQSLAQWFPDQQHHVRMRAGNKTFLRIYGGKAFSGCKQLPSLKADPSYLLGFLAGYLAADGHVAKDGTVMLNSARASHLEHVRDISTAVGIVTYGVTTQRRIGIDGLISALHRIHFVPASLHPSMFLLPLAKERFEQSNKRFSRLRWAVTQVEPTSRVDDVYCARVPVEHAFALDDHILTGNCFGCSAHGDAIRFLTDARGLPFMDAVKELAGKAGMEVPAPDPRDAEKQERAKGLHDVMAAAQAWFEEQLNGIDGGEARAYLAQRGISDATRQKFGFGFAPDARGKLKAALASIGNEKLIEAGLLIAPDDAKPDGGKNQRREPYDRFRGRLTYPIKDQRGRVIAFSARILGAGEPKYLNSPDTPLFDKGRSLFNIDRAGPASRTAKRLLVVEGQMDAIALDQAGIGEVVAPLGTAVTEAQLERMWRLEPAPIFCFDGDSAGEKAAVRAAQRALPHLAPERTLRFVSLPSGQDPDDLVRSGGAAAMEALLAAAEPLVDRMWRHEVAALPLDTPEARAGLKARLLDHVAAIGDPNVRQLYRDEWLRRFDALVRPNASAQRGFAPRHERGRPWRKDGNRFVPPPLPPQESTRGVHRSGIEPPIARALLTGFILYPDALHDYVEELAHLALADRSSATLRDELVRIAMSGQHLDREGLQTILADKAAGKEVRRGAMRFSFTRLDSDPAAALSDLGAALEAAIARTEIDAALADATRRLEQDVTDEAYAEQQRLKEAQTRFNERLASLAGNE